MLVKEDIIRLLALLSVGDIFVARKLVQEQNIFLQDLGDYLSLEQLSFDAKTDILWFCSNLASLHDAEVCSNIQQQLGLFKTLDKQF